MPLARVVAGERHPALGILEPGNQVGWCDRVDAILSAHRRDGGNDEKDAKDTFHAREFQWIVHPPSTIRTCPTTMSER